MAGLIRLFSRRSNTADPVPSTTDDPDNSKSTPTTNPPGVKIERRESTRLASGASKLIRAFRTGTSRKVEENNHFIGDEFSGNCRRTFEPPVQPRISPNPKGSTEAHAGHLHPRHTPPRDVGRKIGTPAQTSKGPTRRFSFQNGGSTAQNYSDGLSIHNKNLRNQTSARLQSLILPEQKNGTLPRVGQVHVYENLEVVRANVQEEQVDHGGATSAHSYVNLPILKNSNIGATHEKGTKLKPTEQKEPKSEKRPLRRSASEVPPDRVQNNQLGPSALRQSSRSAVGSSGVTPAQPSRNSKNSTVRLWNNSVTTTSGRKEENFCTIPRTPKSTLPTDVVPISKDAPEGQPDQNFSPTRSTPNLVGDQRPSLPLSVHMPLPNSPTSWEGSKESPGHEKYPSWPFPLQNSGPLKGHSATKSWTEESKTLRPYVHMKSGFEGLRPRSTHPPSLGYRDTTQHSNGSWRERDDKLPSTDDLDLTSSKRSTYAHSEGYHSFISDSTSLASSSDQLLKCLSTPITSATPAQSYSTPHLDVTSTDFENCLNSSWRCSEEESWAEELRQRSRTSPQLQIQSIPKRRSPPPLPERKESYSSLKKTGTTASIRSNLGTLGFREDVTKSSEPIEISPTIDTRPPPSVAERICELEFQAATVSRANSKSNLYLPKRDAEPQPQTPSNSTIIFPSSPESDDFAYFDSEKRHLVPGNTLKAIQKQALLAYYERHAKKGLCKPVVEKESSRLARQMENGAGLEPPRRPPKKPHLIRAKTDDSLGLPPPPPPRPVSRRSLPPPPPSESDPPPRNPPPLPCKSTVVHSLPSPDLPPPPPHFLVDEEPPPDDPLPPPPTPTEMFITEREEPHTTPDLNLVLVEKVVEVPSCPTPVPYTARSQNTTTLSSTGWEEYHNIGVPMTTVVFASHEFTTGANTTSTATLPAVYSTTKVSTPFQRSVSVDASSSPTTTTTTSSTNSNGGVNRLPPPVAQVAPLRGNKYCQRTTSMTMTSDGRSFKVIDPEINTILPLVRSGIQQTAKVSPLRESRAAWAEDRQSTTTSEASSQTDDGTENDDVRSLSEEQPIVPTQQPIVADFKPKPVTLLNQSGNINLECEDLKKQKDELVCRLSRKLEILRQEQEAIREEIRGNETLGESVVEKVRISAKRNEFDKFKLHVEEIGKITNLILGLSCRLARTETSLLALSTSPLDAVEKKTVERKRDRLRDQLEEAELLKESIDRRASQVSGFLKIYLCPEDFADYVHFTSMKAKLIIDGREIEEKIKLGEEQMMALEESSKDHS